MVFIPPKSKKLSYICWSKTCLRVKGQSLCNLSLSPWQTRTHCCGHKFCVRDTKVFLILFRNILCPQQMFPSLRSVETQHSFCVPRVCPGNIMSNNVFTTMCPRLPGARFLKLLVITGPVKLFCFPIQMGDGIKRFESCTVKLSAKETIWTSLEVRIHPSFQRVWFQNMISGPLSYWVFREKRPQRLQGVYQTTTETETSPNKRFNEQNNSCALPCNSWYMSLPTTKCTRPSDSCKFL